MKIKWHLTDTRRDAAIYFNGEYPLDVVEVIQPRAGNTTGSAYISYPSNSHASIAETSSYAVAIDRALHIAAKWETLYAGSGWQDVTGEFNVI